MYNKFMKCITKHRSFVTLLPSPSSRAHTHMLKKVVSNKCEKCRTDVADIGQSHSAARAVVTIHRLWSQFQNYRHAGTAARFEPARGYSGGIVYTEAAPSSPTRPEGSSAVKFSKLDRSIVPRRRAKMAVTWYKKRVKRRLCGTENRN